MEYKKLDTKELYEKRGTLPFFICPNILFDGHIVNGKTVPYMVYDCKKEEEREINIYEKMLLGYIFRCSNNGETAFPSFNTMAKSCSMSERQARFSIKNLEKSGYLNVERRKDSKNGANLSSIYYINIKKLIE